MTKWVIYSLIILFCSGCAGEVVRYPAELPIAGQQQKKRYVTLQTVLVRFDSGYERKINSGTEFIEIGLIKQGQVLKPVSTVFTVEGAHMHEAYPVISNGRIVGFYLPAEQAFSPLSQSVLLSIQEKEAIK